MPNQKENEDRHERAHGGVLGKRPPFEEEKEYVSYTDEEWDDLAREKNLNNETLKNIIVEVEQDKPGLDWLEGRGHALAPT